MNELVLGMSLETGIPTNTEDLTQSCQTQQTAVGHLQYTSSSEADADARHCYRFGRQETLKSLNIELNGDDVFIAIYREKKKQTDRQVK